MAELTAINWACCIDGLKEDLNFTPHYNLEIGIKETVDWYILNKWLK